MVRLNHSCVVFGLSVRLVMLPVLIKEQSENVFKTIDPKAYGLLLCASLEFDGARFIGWSKYHAKAISRR